MIKHCQRLIQKLSYVKLWDHTSIAVTAINANAMLLPLICSSVERLPTFKQRGLAATKKTKTVNVCMYIVTLRRCRHPLL